MHTEKLAEVPERVNLGGRRRKRGRATARTAAPIVFRGVTAAAGVWSRITVGDMGDVSLEHVVLSDAGASYFFVATALAINGKASIQNVTIMRSAARAFDSRRRPT